MSALLTLLTDVMTKIEDAVFQGMVALQEPLVALMVALAIIGIAITWEMYFSADTWNWGNIFVKIVQVGFYAFLIRNWKMFLAMTKQTGEQLGLTAGGLSGTLTPNAIVVKGINGTFTAIKNILKDFSMSPATLLTQLLAIIILLIANLAYLKIAFTLFMVNAEFLIVGGLSMVLLPFGVNRLTKGIADKIWGIMLTNTVKLMVATFMVAITSTFIENAFRASSTSGNPDIPNLLLDTLSVAFLAFLIDKSVEYAGAMTNGLTISTPDLVSTARSAANYAATGKQVAGKALGAAWRHSPYTDAIGAKASQAWGGIKAGARNMRQGAYNVVGNTAKTGYNAVKNAWWGKY